MTKTMLHVYKGAEFPPRPKPLAGGATLRGRTARCTIYGAHHQLVDPEPQLTRHGRRRRLSHVRGSRVAEAVYAQDERDGLRQWHYRQLQLRPAGAIGSQGAHSVLGTDISRAR